MIRVSFPRLLLIHHYNSTYCVMTENIFNKFTRLFMSSLDSMMSANIWHDPFTYFTEKPICSQEFQFACSNILVSEVRRVGLRNPNPMFAHSNSLAGAQRPQTEFHRPIPGLCLPQCSMDFDIKATKHSLLDPSGQSVKHSVPHWNQYTFNRSLCLC